VIRHIQRDVGNFQHVVSFQCGCGVLWSSYYQAYYINRYHVMQNVNYGQ
jgi:hypothetical protein